jgi:hypothetical protein
MVIVVEACVIVSTTAAELLAARFPFPPYVAVMEWVPGVNVETVNCALLLASVAVPIAVAPSKNVTVPLAVLPAEGCTVAVSVIV